VHTSFLDCAHLLLRSAQSFSSVHTRYSGTCYKVCTDIPRLVTSFSGLCTPYSSVHSHILVCTLVFWTVHTFFQMCTVITPVCTTRFFWTVHTFSSVHSHILVCTLVFLDCAQVFPDVPQNLIVFRDILRLVRGSPRYSETCVEVFPDCATPFL